LSYRRPAVSRAAGFQEESLQTVVVVAEVNKRVLMQNSGATWIQLSISTSLSEPSFSMGA